MTTFIILAGGRGTRVSRVGGDLHKALLPLDGRAVLSHIIDLAPADARIVISTGDRADQIRDYVALAHPSHASLVDRITFVHAVDWDKPMSGPGTGLIAAMSEVPAGDDVVFTTCDTLWDANMVLDRYRHGSWLGVAPLPAGTSPERWCRVATDRQDRVVRVLDKVTGDAPYVYVGVARIAGEDFETFYKGVLRGTVNAGEHQVSGGFEALLPGIAARYVPGWLDVGDEHAYRDAVARMTGYDWTKTGQATYVLPEEGRVVKYASDAMMIANRERRTKFLDSVVPRQVATRPNMLAYDYVPGVTAYEALDRDPDVHADLMRWFQTKIWSRRLPDHAFDGKVAVGAALRFYRDKTFDRIDRIENSHDRRRAEDAADRIDWDWLARGVIPGTWHGDLNYGNILITRRVRAYPPFVGIDWREDFAGIVEWGDLRYDLAKLLAGTVVHWGNARRGDFRRWPRGEYLAREIREFAEFPDQLRAVEIIGALSLLNSAPLHAQPLDEILVARGCAWLEEIL